MSGAVNTLPEEGTPLPAEAQPLATIVAEVNQPSKPAAPGELSLNDLMSRMVLHSPGLVNELYQLAQRQQAEEFGRQARLDAKATSLLSAVGLSLTVALTFGGQTIASKSGDLQRLLTWRFPVVVVLFAGSVLAGLVAGGYALRALRVRGGGAYGALREDTVFRGEVLHAADELSTNDDAQGVAYYRRFITPQLWRIVQRQIRTHAAKARLIFRGQVAFGIFLVLLFLVGLLFISTIGGLF